MKKFLKMLGLASARDLAEVEEALDEAAKALAEAYTKAEAAPAADVWTDVEAATAAEAAEVPPALFEEAEVEAEVANAALVEAEANLEKVSQAKAKAEAEASILDEVHEVNRLTRQLIVQMGEKKLLPEQLQQRRKDAEQDNASVQEALKDLGI